MTPDQLRPESFSAYAPAARAFAIRYLSLLRQLPLSVCPSFLSQISLLDVRFPAERADLDFTCSHLAAMDPTRLDALLSPLRAIHLPAELEKLDWVAHPDAYVERLSAALWADGQINDFHTASRTFLDAVQPPLDSADRLLLIVLGNGANTAKPRLLHKLAGKGLRVEGLRADTAQQELLQLVQRRAAADATPYSHWYIDGGRPWPVNDLPSAVTHTSYDALRPLRQSVLQRMRATVHDQQSNAEDMRSTLAASSPAALGGSIVSSDPVLQYFYTQLFTQGSGTQIFSTSFVQWAGRELARRARPRTVLLRYGPRQRYRGLNAMFEQPEDQQMDVEGSLGDAEMDAFYNWIEMTRVCSPGRLTTFVWAEGSTRAVVIGPKTQPKTVTQQVLTVGQLVAAMQSA